MEGLGLGESVRSAVNHRLESRVREIRTHGLAGGGACGPSYPYQRGGSRTAPTKKFMQARRLRYISRAPVAEALEATIVIRAAFESLKQRRK
jgi:hypothetical protein